LSGPAGAWLWAYFWAALHYAPLAAQFAYYGMLGTAGTILKWTAVVAGITLGVAAMGGACYYLYKKLDKYFVW
jgi:hypothetical protein